MNEKISCPHCGVLEDKHNLFCSSCTKVLPMVFTDYFKLFELPITFNIDLNLLDKRLFEKLQKFHPDKFIVSTDLEKRFSIENSNQINIAYKILKSPLLRTKYMLELQGVNTEEAKNLDDEFLLETLEWREQLVEKKTANEVQSFLEQIKDSEKQMLSLLAELFNQSIYIEALKVYIRLKFIQRFKNEVEKKLLNEEKNNYKQLT